MFQGYFLSSLPNPLEATTLTFVVRLQVAILHPSHHISPETICINSLQVPVQVLLPSTLMFYRQYASSRFTCKYIIRALCKYIIRALCKYIINRALLEPLYNEKTRFWP